MRWHWSYLRLPQDLGRHSQVWTSKASSLVIDILVVVNGGSDTCQKDFDTAMLEHLDREVADLEAMPGIEARIVGNTAV